MECLSSWRHFLLDWHLAELISACFCMLNAQYNLREVIYRNGQMGSFFFWITWEPKKHLTKVNIWFQVDADICLRIIKLQFKSCNGHRPNVTFIMRHATDIDWIWQKWKWLTHLIIWETSTVLSKVISDEGWEPQGVEKRCDQKFSEFTRAAPTSSHSGLTRTFTKWSDGGGETEERTKTTKTRGVLAKKECSLVIYVLFGHSECPWRQETSLTFQFWIPLNFNATSFKMKHMLPLLQINVLQITFLVQWKTSNRVTTRREGPQSLSYHKQNKSVTDSHPDLGPVCMTPIANIGQQ